MLEEGARQFDLYDVISVLLPGSLFVIGVLPFFPDTISLTSTGGLVLLLLASFVIGRALHAVGLLVERPLGEEVHFVRYLVSFRGEVATNHRDEFVNELLSPQHLSKGLVDEFYTEANDYFTEISLPDDRGGLERNDHKDDLETLYTLVRSFIHMDGRGRSRTFQAVLDFQRTAMIAASTLALIYVSYGILKSLGRLPTDLADYTSFMLTLDIAGWVLMFGGGFVLSTAYVTFEKVRSNYRRYFIQYLMSDFINLQKVYDSQEE